MMKNFVNLLIYFILFGILSRPLNCEISDKRLCADPECKTIISFAKTLVNYPSGGDGLLSFRINKDVRVYSKSAGSNPALWGVEIQGQRGYVNKKLLKEVRVLVKSSDLIYEVPTHLVELQQKQVENELLKGSQPEIATVEATTTAPLPEESNSQIRTDQSDVNSGNEKITHPSPVQSKFEVVDGTTVTFLEDDEKQNSVEEVDDDGIIVEDEDGEKDSVEVLGVENITMEPILPNQQNVDPLPAENINLNLVPPNQESVNTIPEFKPININADQLEILSGQILSEPDQTLATNENDQAETNTTKEESETLTLPEVTPTPDILNVESVTDTNNVLQPDSISDQNTANADESLSTPKPITPENTKEGITLDAQKNSDVELTPNENTKNDDQNNNSSPTVEEQVNIESNNAEQSGATTPEVTTNEEIINGNEYQQPPPNSNILENQNVIVEEPHIYQTTPGYEQGFYDQNPILEATTSSNMENTTPLSIPQSPEINNSDSQNTQEVPLIKDEVDIVPEIPKPESPLDLNSQVDPFTTESSKEVHIEETTTFAPESETLTTPSDDPVLESNQQSNEVIPESVPSSLHEDHTQHNTQEHVPYTTLPPPPPPLMKLEQKGLFDSILENLYGLWPSTTSEEEKPDEKFDESLQKLLFPDQEVGKETPKSDDDGFCENLSPDSCPTSSKFTRQSNGLPHSRSENLPSNENNTNKLCTIGNDFVSLIASKFLEMTDLIICIGITALTLLIFAFGYYCITNRRGESALVSKLNIVERSLLAANKGAMILKQELIETKGKLASIEDNSFGSNDMVISLKKELEENETERFKMMDQIASLEKELENAAEAGLELNKIVSELLNNQSGEDSIISSVEELQKQLNEQQNTILEINTTLAEKSRENSELQIILSEQAAKYQEEIENLKALNEALQNDKNSIQLQLDDANVVLENQISKLIEEKDAEIAKIVQELSQYKEKYEVVLQKSITSEARLEALDESLNKIKSNPKVNMKEFIEAVDIKGEMLALKKERDSLKERLEGEIDARKLLEDHVKIVSEEVSALKQEYNQSEKEKLEAQTRLEVLSSYFKDKETQLQKELSVKEAMWMKQQGETTSTVERVRSMQDEIQSLKSQNDSLRAEIEAQTAAHKAQISSLENRAHETWLAARQSERKLEEARSESTALRRKLTAIAGGNPLSNDSNRVTNSVDGLTNDLNNAPSPIHMESPGSPLLGGLPPPPPFLPPPFMAPPHPFMSIPPQFMPPGEMRPPPLGRLMSPPPPPPSNRYSPSIVDERDRYSPGNGRYTPDSRYNYNTDIMSTYDTETDYSPPPSPHGRSGGGGYNSRERERSNRGYKSFSPQPNSDRSKKSKGVLSSGSGDSYDSRKAKGKGKGGGGGKGVLV